MNLFGRLSSSLSFTLFILAILQATCTTAIYDDQFGAEDWHKKSIGKIDKALFSEAGNTKKLSGSVTVISKESKAIASLLTKNGNLAWRHIHYEEVIDVLAAAPGYVILVTSSQFFTYNLENGQLMGQSSHGMIKDFVSSSIEGTSAVFLYDKGNTVATLSNYKTAIKNHKNIKFKTSELNPTARAIEVVTDEDGDQTIFSIGDIFAGSAFGGFYKNGEEVSTLQCQNSVLLHDSVFVSCLDNTAFVDGNTQETVRVGSEEDKIPQLEGLVAYESSVLGYSSETFYKISRSEIQKHTVSGEIVSFHIQNHHAYIFHKARRSVNGAIQVEVLNLDAFFTKVQHGLDFSITGYNAIPQSVTLDEFQSNGKSYTRILYQNSRNSLLTYNGIWSREEALANVENAVLLELPEDEHVVTDVHHGFWARLELHIDSALDFVVAFFELLAKHISTPQGSTFFEDFNRFLDGDKLKKDVFGVRKLIFVITKSSETAFVLDSDQGEVIHRIDLPELFDSMKTVVYRAKPQTVRIVTISDDKKVTGVFEVNALEGSSVKIWNGDDKIVKNVLSDVIIFEDKSIKYLTEDLPKEVFFVDQGDADLTGYVLTEGELIDLWTFPFTEGQKIIAFNRQDNRARTHAIGRALNDRSIQYKYLNPHLAVLITHTPPINDESFPKITIYAIDTITGSVIFTQTHEQATLPVQCSIVDHWISYSYWDQKKRRFQLESLEFYRGKAKTFAQMEQFATETFESSASVIGSQDLRVLRQGYIIPFEPSTIKPTLTKKGITQRSLLIPSKFQGIIVSIPHNMLDARRTPHTYKLGQNGQQVRVHQSATDMDDSYELPGGYYPEIIMNPDTLLTTNRTIIGVNNIFVAAAELESTCVVLAVGSPDLFFSRNIAPSKHFDRLESGFARSGLLSACVVLFVVTFFLKSQSDWKIVKRAWE